MQSSAQLSICSQQPAQVFHLITVTFSQISKQPEPAATGCDQGLRKKHSQGVSAFILVLIFHVSFSCAAAPLVRAPHPHLKSKLCSTGPFHSYQQLLHFSSSLRQQTSELRSKPGDAAAQSDRVFARSYLTPRSAKLRNQNSKKPLISAKHHRGNRL